MSEESDQSRSIVPEKAHLVDESLQISPTSSCQLPLSRSSGLLDDSFVAIGTTEDEIRSSHEDLYRMSLFCTTKPTGEGTGLGLSLSHDIVVQGHRGEMRVQSEEGGGTTFVVSLPAG